MADDDGQHNSNVSTGTLAYVKAVLAHSYRTSEHSLFPGLNYWHLAQYLNKPFSPFSSSLSLSQKENFNFAVLHDLSLDTDDKNSITYFDAGATGLATLSGRREASTSGAELLFLRGCPSPEWLGVIGSRYRIDPEYFRRHMDFCQSEDYFELPGMPTSSMNILQLPVYTIGSNNSIQYSRKDFTQIRQQAAQTTRDHLRHLANRGEIGESIIRRAFVHDQRYNSTEQLVSICVENRGNGWTAVVWLDGGRALPLSRHTSPSHGSATYHQPGHRFLPVIQHKPKIAFKSYDRSPVPLQTPQQRHPESVMQSLSFLPGQYGRTLNRKIARVDAFYALSELLSFAAASECQMLNMLEKQMANEDSAVVSDMQISLGNLQYIKSILDTHAEYVVATTSFIGIRGDLKWPQATETAAMRLVSQTADNLRLDYEELRRRIQKLSDRCSAGMNLITNRAMLAESQRAIAQAGGIARLTLLAFLFLPLSFTSSLFGMNFRELGNNNPDLSIWVWVAVTLPVFLGSLILCFPKETVKLLRNLLFWR